MEKWFKVTSSGENNINIIHSTYCVAERLEK
jgi:hypothetical protein